MIALAAIVAYSPAFHAAPALTPAVTPTMTPIDATIRERAEMAAAIEAVIAGIADEPSAVRAIVGAQVAATPAYRDGIAAGAIAAYPGFASVIAEAAGYTPRPPAPVPVYAVMVAPPAIAAPPLRAAAPVAAPISVSESRAFGAPYLAAVRLGVLEQDIDFIGTSFEDGQAINPEVQFRAPGLLSLIYSPRPTLGGTISTDSGTNFLYGGLDWHFEPFSQGSFLGPVFFDAFFGFALHDGNSSDLNRAKEKTLGCDVLFREALEVGARIARHYTVSLIVSHLSHGEILCPNSRNRGMDHFGVRLGYEY